MPNPIAHLDIALESVAQSCPPVIEANMGSFLLGSCAPDIRVITRGDRDETHFAPMSNQVLGTGIQNMFKAYPQLGHAASLSGPTQAFLAGYISHLMADESWIIQVYRPYFANRDVFQDRVAANVLDRALQLDMDRRAVEKQGLMKQAQHYLAQAGADVQVAFLPTEALADWHGWLTGVVQREFSWERLKVMALRRQDPQDHARAQEVAEQFLKALPVSLDGVYDLVPRDVLASYRNDVMRVWTEFMRGYLP